MTPILKKKHDARVFSCPRKTCKGRGVFPFPNFPNLHATGVSSDGLSFPEHHLRYLTSHGSITSFIIPRGEYFRTIVTEKCQKSEGEFSPIRGINLIFQYSPLMDATSHMTHCCTNECSGMFDRILRTCVFGRQRLHQYHK